MSDLKVFGRLAALGTLATFVCGGALSLQVTTDAARPTTGFNNAAAVNRFSAQIVCSHDPEGVMGRGGNKRYAAALSQINQIMKQDGLSVDTVKKSVHAKAGISLSEREDLLFKIHKFNLSLTQVLQKDGLEKITSFNAAPVTPYFTAINYGHMVGVLSETFPQTAAKMRTAENILNDYIFKTENQDKCVPQSNPFAAMPEPSAA